MVVVARIVVLVNVFSPVKDWVVVLMTPREVVPAFGILKVWVVLVETILKSLPLVPTAKSWVEVARPLREVSVSPEALSALPFQYNVLPRLYSVALVVSGVEDARVSPFCERVSPDAVVVASVIVPVNVLLPAKVCVLVETIPSAVVDAYGSSERIDDVPTSPLFAVRIPVRLPRYNVVAVTPESVEVPVIVSALDVVVASVIVPVNVLSPAKDCVVVLMTPREVVPAFGILKVWVVLVETILKSLPLVPTAKSWVEVARPLMNKIEVLAGLIAKPFQKSVELTL